MAEPAVVCHRLHVRRGEVHALRGLHLTVAPGVVTGVLGPSGSGKSTMLRCIVGTQIITSGSVTVLGRPAGSAALRRRVGYSSQGAAVYRDLTVRENVGYFAALIGAPRSDVDRVIGEVALADDADRVVVGLSGGQLARVSLAVALLGRPELLVLDEPTVGLDPVLREDLWQLFTRLAADGVTVLVSSHVMDEARRCAALVLLRDGDILATGTPAELTARTGTDDMDAAFLALVESGPDTAPR